MKKYLLFISIICIGIVSCNKLGFLGNDPTGEALGPLSLLAPTTGDSIILNVATPSKTITLSWTAATPGLHTAPTYKWVAALKDGGDIDAPIISIPSDNGGTATTLTLTQTQVDSILGAHSIAVGNAIELIWSVVADNGSTIVRASGVNNISIKRFQTNGVSAFVILGPASSTSSITINPGSTTDSLKFNWMRAIGTPSSTPVLYKIYFYKDDGSTTPLFSMTSNNSGADSVFTISYKDLSDALSGNGFADLTVISNLKWTVTASSGDVSSWSDYTNQLYVVRQVNLFLVGGATPIGWTPTDALQFIQDNSTNGVYYIYTYLTPGNNGFKLLSLKADWSAPGQNVFGETNGADQSGNSGANNTGVLVGGGGNNIAVPGGAGVYRIQVNLTAMTYNIAQKGVGIVGFVNGWDANNPIYMNYMGVNKFMILQDFTVGNEAFKFHDGVNGWTGGYGNSNYWGVPGGDTYDPNNGKNKLVIPGSNNVFENDNPKPAAGMWRVIWDGSDVSKTKYQITYANTMRIVGDAITPNWDPGNSPQMVYQGNGVWKATNVTLEGGKNFKFVASGAWPSGGADDKYYFDYEANGPGKVADNGGDNIAFSGSTGSYTVTLDEYNQTYTIQ